MIIDRKYFVKFLLKREEMVSFISHLKNHKFMYMFTIMYIQMHRFMEQI